MEGFGTYHFGDGEVYEGEHKAGLMDGKGTYRYADGTADVGTFRAGEPVGAGVGWSADRLSAWWLNDGAPQDISPDDAQAMARRMQAPPIIQSV